VEDRWSGSGLVLVPTKAGVLAEAVAVGRVSPIRDGMDD
jgi:hypothetical protein